MMNPVWAVSFLFFVTATTQQRVFTDPFEKQLIDHLFTNYNPVVRPTEHPTDTLNITVQLFLESIKEVNEKDGSITVSACLTMVWKDYYLSWNRTEFGNISFILADAEKVWRPDIVYYSTISERVFHVNGTFMGIYDGGKVVYAPGGMSTHICDYNVRLFPFDIQTCTFSATTWFSAASNIRLIPLEFVYDVTRCNDLWFVMSNISYTNIIDEHNPMQVRFTLTMRRKPLYYIVYVIIPLLMLAFLNVVVFRVPPESEEKISLSITILLAFAIWLTMLSSLTPRSSDTIPLLGMFITALMLLSAISTAISVYIVRIHYFDQCRKIPSWANYLSRLFKKHHWMTNNDEQSQKKKGDDISNPVSWHAVATALDQLAFIVMLLLTFLLILACIIGFVALYE